MTVMFCDLVDSTPLAELLDPEDFREVLTDYRQACLRSVERFGGYTALYAGDGMTVYFGYPRAHEDDAQRAVHTALAILAEIDALNVRLQDLYGVAVQVRMGVHSGVVIAEELGGGAAETPWQLDVSGEMPHIAARLETLAPPGSVVVSDTTRDLVEGWFETEPLGEKKLKGVSQPVTVHRIVRPTGAIARIEIAAAGRLTPLVGRVAERARLAAVWDQTRRGSGAAVHISGEAGIGKSRLVHDLIEATAQQPGSSQRWQCSAHHRSTSLYPVTTYLERSLGLDREGSVEQQNATLRQALEAARIDADEALPLLADILRIGGKPVALLGLSPRDARTAALQVLEALLVADVARHPLLLVVEDLHWADPTTIELLGRIVRNVGQLPVMCVMTSRADIESTWRPEPDIIEIAVGPLAPAEVRALAAAASAGPLDPELLAWVTSTADGVPLFVEEMLKAGQGPQASGVPPTLEGLLTERLDRLPELAEVIDVAAILGREFDRSLLGALGPLAGKELEPTLEQLAAHDVIRPVRGASSRCEFAHSLLHEAAYARILRRRQRALHRSVAETLTGSFPEKAERAPELVARHWAAAGEPALAVPLWHRAGTRALERAAYIEAADHFRRGLEALDQARAGSEDDVEQVDFLTHLAASLQAGHGYAAAGVEAAYSRARSACERLCDDDRRLPVIRGQWMLHLLKGEYATALALADEMLDLATRSGRSSAVPEGQLYRGLVHMYLGAFEPARVHLEKAFTSYAQPEVSDYVYEAQGDTGVGALAYLALVLWNLGFPEEAQERSDLSLERAQTVGGPVTRAQAWGMRSILHLGRAEPTEMSMWVRRTYAHSVDNDLGYWRAVSSLLGGWLQGRAGQLEQGAARVQESLDAYLHSGSRLGLPYFRMLCADLRRLAGDRPGALDQLRMGEDYIAESGERYSESELLRFKAHVLASGDSPDMDGATEALMDAVRAAREQEAKLLELQAIVRLAEHQRRTDEPCTALERTAELCDWFGSESSLPDVGRARALLSAEPMTR